MLLDRYCKLNENKKEITAVSYERPIPEEVKKQAEQRFETTYVDKEEGYIILVEDGRAKVYANTERGKIYAEERLKAAGEKGLGEGIIYNYPILDFRMLKLYLPSEENFSCFKELIDFFLHYGYNTIMLEVGGAMEYRKHPEINEGWLAYSRIARDNLNGRGDNPYFPFAGEEIYFEKNSIHSENGDGTILSQEKVRELIAYCRERHMEVIPEVPSFSHSDYLLTAHPELAERSDDLYPDTYCPSNPATYELLFDVLQEVIDVFEPAYVNICHDELYNFGICEKCRQKDSVDLYVEDVMKIYRFLKERGVGTMIWADKLINCTDKQGVNWAGARKVVRHPRTGEITQIVPPTWPAIDRLPRDIRLSHWYWSVNEQAEKDFMDRGYWTAFTNFEPLRAKHVQKRFASGIDGVGISNWSKVEPVHVLRNGIYADMALTAMYVWGPEVDEENVDENLKRVAADLYRYRCRNSRWRAKIVHSFDTDRRILESMYNSDLSFEGERTWYHYALLSNKEIKSVKMEIFAEYEGFLLHKFTIVQKLRKYI